MTAGLQLGIVADDHTGATDAAGMLTERGVRTLLFLGPPTAADLALAAGDYGAVVIGLGTRSVARESAYEQTAAAVRLLRAAAVRKIQIKYCSTFDSTPRGNIGPTLDAALDCLNVPGTIVCPALPVNGRTTYCGHHFVNGQLLSESPLSRHPLNPMTDSNLVRWLQHQTVRRVTCVDWQTIRRGIEPLRAALNAGLARGDSYFVTDALEQSDLRAIAQATSEWSLVSGGSGITSELPGILFPSAAPLAFSQRLAQIDKGTLVVAGSCSPATRAQNAFAMDRSFAAIRLDGLEILDGKIDPKAMVTTAANELARGKNVLLYSSADGAEVERVQAAGRAKGLSVEQTGFAIGAALADIAAALVAEGKVGRLVVSGGETSAAVCRRLNISALEVGLPIEPGVPYCFPVGRPNLVVVLKSGNFGSPDLYVKVADQLA